MPQSFISRFKAENWLLPALVLLYGMVYAPYGVNESDGGFISGLAWQVLQGKTLYQDLIYVRPPLPVWWRALEMCCTPESWWVLSERWLFYIKAGVYSWLAADLLLQGRQRAVLAALGFVVSVHTYPAAAWHTVDGILFGVSSAWVLGRWRGWPGQAAGAGLLSAAVLCKQSFYPLLLAWPVLVFYRHGWKNAAGMAGCSALFLGLFYTYLYKNGIITNYLHMTGAVSEGGQALQHGVLDFFRIQPFLLLFTAFIAVLYYFFRKKWLFGLAFAGLAGSYVVALGRQQDFQAPFAQARMCFDVALLYGGWQIWTQKWPLERAGAWLMLMALCWCSAVSWGYNLPILLATPWVAACYDMQQRFCGLSEKKQRFAEMAALALLLAAFHYGYQFVYRDGRRSDMRADMGQIFPVLQGIYSTPQKAAMYRELKYLHEKYPVSAVAPAFPQADLLLGARPLLPLDWKVRRETAGLEGWLDQAVQRQPCYLLVQKTYLPRLETDPELAWLRHTLVVSRPLADSCVYFAVFEH
jgi:hypothetical protein